MARYILFLALMALALSGARSAQAQMEIVRDGTPMASDGAGNRQFRLIMHSGTINPEEKAAADDDRSPSSFCTEKFAAGYCVNVRKGEGDDQWIAAIMPNWMSANPCTVNPKLCAIPLTGLFESDSNPRAIWTVHEADGQHIVIAFETNRIEGYSGGGASTQRVFLTRVNRQTGAAVQSEPVQMMATAMIRACFGEEDMKQRAGACHDEYEYEADFALDQANASGPPRFIYTTKAAHYPKGVARWEDSLTKPRLKKKDLVWETDPECTFRRVFTLRSSDGEFAPDEAMPECSDYGVMIE